MTRIQVSREVCAGKIEIPIAQKYTTMANDADYSNTKSHSNNEMATEQSTSKTAQETKVEDTPHEKELNASKNITDTTTPTTEIISQETG